MTTNYRDTLYVIHIDDEPHMVVDLAFAQKISNVPLNLSGAHDIASKMKKIDGFVKRNAMRHCNTLAQEHLGKAVRVKHKGRYLNLAKKRYCDNDPLWNAQPDYQQSCEIISSIITQALADATEGKITAKGISVCNKPASVITGAGRAFIKGAYCKFLCELIDLDHAALLRKYYEVVK